jgi:glycosyltransferase involved in cell wall biosynthesis
MRSTSSMLSVIVTTYNQPQMLAIQEAAWSDYPEGVEVIVVDDGGKVPAKAGGCQLYRVTEDIPWHQDGARNLGAHVAEGEWLLFLDVDHVLTAEAARMALRSLRGLAKYCAYRPQRRLISGAYRLSPAPNIWLIRREDFWRIGAYDERLCGTYGTDLEFRPRLKRHLQERSLPIKLDVYTRDVIADAATQGLSRELVHPPNLGGDPLVLAFDWVRVQ